MKKIVTVLVVMIGLSPVMNSQSIGNIGDDKVYHFLAGSFFGGAVQGAIYSETGNVKKAFTWGLLSSFTVGLAKEVVDEIQYGGFDVRDLAATILGGVAVTVPLNFSWKRHKKVTGWKGFRNGEPRHPRNIVKSLRVK